MSFSYITSSKAPPVWCYGCNVRATYTEDSSGNLVCDYCGHEHRPPRKRHRAEGNGHRFKKAKSK